MKSLYLFAFAPFIVNASTLSAIDSGTYSYYEKNKTNVPFYPRTYKLQFFRDSAGEFNDPCLKVDGYIALMLHSVITGAKTYVDHWGSYSTSVNTTGSLVANLDLTNTCGDSISGYIKITASRSNGSISQQSNNFTIYGSTCSVVVADTYDLGNLYRGSSIGTTSLIKELTNNGVVTLSPSKINSNGEASLLSENGVSVGSYFMNNTSPDSNTKKWEFDSSQFPINTRFNIDDHAEGGQFIEKLNVKLTCL